MHIGSSGDNVRQLQTLLKHDLHGLAVDGVYGPRTERAVRIFQRCHGLYPPDGIVGPITLQALGARRPAPNQMVPQAPPPPGTAPPPRPPVPTARPLPTPLKPAPVAPHGPGPLTQTVAPSIDRAKHVPAPDGEVRPAASRRTSTDGLKLIFDHEAQRGVSNHLYWPKGASGVTLGAGYDMKERSSSEIAEDLMAIRVPADVAAQVGAASGLQNAAAEAFAKNHRSLVDLSRDQETALLRLIITRYERKVQSAIKIDLHTYEFDALVSYAYNPGGGWQKVTRLVNDRKPHEAMTELSKHVISRHAVVKSLVRRRAAEVRLFLYGKYT